MTALSYETTNREHTMIELITTDGKESRIYANMATPFARARTHGVRSVTVIPVTYPRRGAASVRIVYNDGATLAADYESLSVAVAQFTRKGKRAGSPWPMPRVYEPTTFTRVYNDTNGNPRYVVHFSALLPNSPTAICYNEAARIANTIGGRKYRGKDYGGGIVFQSYSLAHTQFHIYLARHRAELAHDKAADELCSTPTLLAGLGHFNPKDLGSTAKAALF